MKQVYRVTKIIGIVVTIATVNFRSPDLEGPTSAHDDEVRMVWLTYKTK